MTLASSLITEARHFLADISDNAYSDTAMLSYLNEACSRFATETHCNQAIVDYTATTNKVTYAQLLDILTTAVAKKILFAVKVEISVAAGNQFLPKALLSEMKDKLPATTLVPTRWMSFAEAVYFDLAPSVSASNAISVYCSYIPAALSSTASEVAIPVQWHHALVRYLMFCAHLADRDAGLANGAFAEYEAVRQQASEYYALLMEG